MVLITTDKVYENCEWEYPYRENDRLGGYDPYSSSKACCEILIDSFRSSFFPLEAYEDHKIAIASCRAGNVIGGGDWAKDRIFPDIARSIYRGSTVKVRNPSSIRPWQHVLDPIFGYLILARELSEHPRDISGPWNFGPLQGDVISVGELVELAIKRWAKGSSSFPEVSDGPHEAGLLRLDISKAQKHLNWSPGWSTSEAIHRTVDWYRNFMMVRMQAY